jgi:hypothetical protein
MNMQANEKLRADTPARCCGYRRIASFPFQIKGSAQTR